MASVPYLTEQQVRDKYAKALTDYTNQRNTEAERARTQVNNQYDTAQRQNYVNYMQNKRELPQMMAQQGITGGASETSALRAQTNYENNYNNAERSRGTELNNINNTLADTLNTYRMTADQNMNDEIAQNRQLRANYEKQLQQEEEQRFANTISGYDNINEIDRLIAGISRTGVAPWRIPYLRARRAELVAAGLAATGGSSGGGGYYYSNNSDGNNPVVDTPASPTYDDYVNAARNYIANRGGVARLGGSTKGSSSSSSSSNNSSKSSGRKSYYKDRKLGTNYRNSKKTSDYSWRK